MKPLRNLVQVERIVETQTKGGIHIPQTFVSRGPAGRLNAKGDYFRARVLAVGPEVREGELSPGEEVLVFTYADGDGSRLYTGESAVGTLFVKYPDDILCAVDYGAPAAVGESPNGDVPSRLTVTA